MRKRAGSSLICAVLSLACPGILSAQILLEAEEAPVVVNVGGAPCDTAKCNFASNGAVVAGIDSLGDYLEWEIIEDWPSYLDFGLRSAATTGQIRKYEVSVRTQGGLLTAAPDTLTTVAGYGVG
jgi:hypothetical protein